MSSIAGSGGGSSPTPYVFLAASVVAGLGLTLALHHATGAVLTGMSERVHASPGGAQAARSCALDAVAPAGDVRPSDDDALVAVEDVSVLVADPGSALVSEGDEVVGSAVGSRDARARGTDPRAPLRRAEATPPPARGSRPAPVREEHRVALAVRPFSIRPRTRR